MNKILLIESTLWGTVQVHLRIYCKSETHTLHFVPVRRGPPLKATKINDSDLPQIPHIKYLIYF